MCLTFEEVTPRLVGWGFWQWKNRGSLADLSYSSNGKMHDIYLKTAACGGGNKVENYNEMTGDIAFVDAMLTKLEPLQFIICESMFVTELTLNQWSIRARKEDAKIKITKKYKISERKFRDELKAFSGAVCTVLDAPQISDKHPYFQKMCCHI